MKTFFYFIDLHDMLFDRSREKIPDILYMERFTTRKGVGPLVSSQERRALLVSRIKRLSNACPMRIWFLNRFT